MHACFFIYTGCAKTVAYEKLIISVTVTHYFTKFTAFTEENSEHLRSNFRYNICYI